MSLPISSTSSGDDHLLTANAHEEHFRSSVDYKNYHDNRAFQYHNNNSLTRSLKNKEASVNNGGVLDVIIVPRNAKETVINGQLKSYAAAAEIHAGSKKLRNNATQTTAELSEILSCQCAKLAHHKNRAGFCSLQSGPTVDSDLVVGEITCHSHVTHHCHHYSPINERNSSSRRKRRQTARCCSKLQPRYAQSSCSHQSCCGAHHEQTASSTKSSINKTRSTCEDHLQQQQQHSHHKSYNSKRLKTAKRPKKPEEHLQSIAIEIDAATMTEDNNSSTATSNFAYKSHLPGSSPIILAPVRPKKLHCQQYSSQNSNTSIDSDELSRDTEGDAEAAIAEDIYQGKRGQQNSSVRIQRKQFIPCDEDFCCSSCSSCSCPHDGSTSCSSMSADENELEFGGNALTVEADCHRCGLQRQSTNTTSNSEELPPNEQQTAAKEDNYSCHSGETTFCSCNSTTYKCSCTEDYRSLAKSASIDEEDIHMEHSNTLTPLTNASTLAEGLTPEADSADLTIHSNASDLSNQTMAAANTLLEDNSSLSQSAEFFSLSSYPPTESPKRVAQKDCSTTTNVIIHQAACASNPSNLSSYNNTQNSNNSSSRKPCKHYSKHHRHKRSESPMDAYL